MLIIQTQRILWDPWRYLWETSRIVLCSSLLFALINDGKSSPPVVSFPQSCQMDSTCKSLNKGLCTNYVTTVFKCPLGLFKCMPDVGIRSQRWHYGSAWHFLGHLCRPVTFVPCFVFPGERAKLIFSVSNGFYFRLQGWGKWRVSVSETSISKSTCTPGMWDWGGCCQESKGQKLWCLLQRKGKEL